MNSRRVKKLGSYQVWSCACGCDVEVRVPLEDCPPRPSDAVVFWAPRHGPAGARSYARTSDPVFDAEDMTWAEIEAEFARDERTEPMGRVALARPVPFVDADFEEIEAVGEMLGIPRDE